MSDHAVYESPLVQRYASDEMCRLFSQRHRIQTWRRIWLALAEAQQRAGLAISAGQIAELRQTLEQIDFEAAAAHERRLRHDIMAHVHTWGDVAPNARGILHLGATSADIGDNADLIIMREGLRIMGKRLANVIDSLGSFARRHLDLPTLGYTHFQPAQVTTVGKRAALWCYDFVRDLEETERLAESMRFRGIKGATGTQASFLALLNKDAKKVRDVELDVARQFGFDAVEPVTGQTYSRKVDANIVGAMGGIGTSVHKVCNDLRLLANLGEMEEPFEAEQVGSSAMPYKRNPMRCERATALARFVMSLVQSSLQTAAEQWFERTLDDSANKRLVVAEAFLATDAMLMLVNNVVRGLTVYPKVIESRLRAELPFLATENIMMAAAAAGGDRQELHERLRRHSRAAADQMRNAGTANDLLDRLRADAAFAAIDFDRVLEPHAYIGLASQQTAEFLAQFVEPIQRRHAEWLGQDDAIRV